MWAPAASMRFLVYVHEGDEKAGRLCRMRGQVEITQGQAEGNG